MHNALVPRRQRGASLVEAGIVLAITATLASSVLAGWQPARERRALEGSSAQLVTDLQLARSHAVAHGLPVRLRVNAAESCYVLHTGPAAACNCSAQGTASCGGGGTVLRVASLAGPVPLQLSSSSNSMLFDSDRGTVSPTGTVRVHGVDGRAVHHVVNIMGRVRTCSPGGAVAGHPRC
jgi:type IV fimbrial biogenesis protein FimT